MPAGGFDDSSARRAPVVDLVRLELVEQIARDRVQRDDRGAVVAGAEHAEGVGERGFDERVIARPVLSHEREIGRCLGEAALLEARANALRDGGAGGVEAAGKRDAPAS